MLRFHFCQNDVCVRAHTYTCDKHTHTHTYIHTYTLRKQFLKDLQETGKKQMFTKRTENWRKGVGGKLHTIYTLLYFLNFELYMLPNFRFFTLNF